VAGASISFVIPVLNEEGRIGRLLERLASSYPDSQVVVVDGGSADGTVLEAESVGCSVLRSASGRAIQMNEGAGIATGDYLFFLHCDTVPTICPEDLQACLALTPDWGFFRVRLSGSHWMFRVIEGAMNLRSRISKVATGDQMIFLRRELFEQTGGYAAIPLMEDIEYCKRLRRIARPVVQQQMVKTSSRRWEQHGIASTVMRMWCLRLAYFLGIPPARLRDYYHAG
jgi:rSAM/selenodomain-associated transferase 2